MVSDPTQEAPSRICPRCGEQTAESRCPTDGATTIDHQRLVSKHEAALVGTLVGGRFELQAQLGAGGYGAVYRGRHIETGGQVAVKLMRPELLADQGLIRRFYLEAQNTHSLHHPNTVRVLDFGLDEEHSLLYLATEFVAGRPLADLIGGETPMPPRRAIRIVSQVLKSLGEAHERGLVHRDVKPANIMLTQQFGEPDFVKVLDFGIARSLDSSTRFTQGAVGTPLYMAPEQCLAMPVDARTDLYSVGVVLYELLSGRLHIPVGPDATAMAIMTSQVQTTPVALSELIPSCPPALSAWVMSCLAKDPDDRPASAAVLLRGLAGLEEAPGGQLDAALAVTGAGEPVALQTTMDSPAVAAQVLDTLEPDVVVTGPTMSKAAVAATVTAPPPGADGEPGVTAEVVEAVRSPARWPLYALVAGLLAVGGWWFLRAPAPSAPAEKTDQQGSGAPAKAPTPQAPEPSPPAAVVRRQPAPPRQVRGAEVRPGRRARQQPSTLNPTPLAVVCTPAEATALVKETGDRFQTPFAGEMPLAVQSWLQTHGSATLVVERDGYQPATHVLRQGEPTVRLTLKALQRSKPSSSPRPKARPAGKTRPKAPTPPPSKLPSVRL